MIWRRWQIIALFAILGLAISIFYGQTRPPEYRSPAVFILEPDDPSGGLPTQARSFYSYPQIRPFEFYTALLGSQSYLDLLRQELADQEFKQRFAEIYKGENIWDLVASSVSLEQGAYEEMIYLTATAEDSLLAYRIAKAATFAYKERLRQIEQEESYNVVNFVNKQREIARENLEDAERQLQRFKETTNITLNEEDGGLMRRLVEYENQLAEAETQQALAQANIEAIEQRLSQIKDPEAISGFEIEDPVSRQYKEQIDKLEAQRNQIAQTNPNSARLDELDRQIERVRNDWIRTIEENMAATGSRPAEGTTREMITEIQSNLLREEMVLYQMKNRVYYYRRLIDNYKRQHPQMLESAIQLTQLQRTKSVYENLYNFLIQRGEEANIKAATSTGGIRIIDEPLMPTEKDKKNIRELKRFVLGNKKCFTAIVFRFFQTHFICVLFWIAG